MGRPKLEVTEQMLKAVSAIAVKQCPDEEIAAYLGISYSTFKRRKAEHPELADAIEVGREAGKQMLRDVQWDMAMSGNVVMAIFLGKQYLGQSDKTDFLGKDGKPFEFTIAINGEKDGDRGKADEKSVQDPGSGYIQ